MAWPCHPPYHRTDFPSVVLCLSAPECTQASASAAWVIIC